MLLKEETMKQVYFAEGYELDVGWNTHEFETPFLWDGYSNILVEIFSDDHYPYPINASVYYSDTSFNGTLRSLPLQDVHNMRMPGISVAKRANMKLGMRASEYHRSRGSRSYGSHRSRGG